MSEPSRITVSREALRAELAEMELRLRIWIASELEEKASAAELAALKGDFHEKVAWAEGLMPLRDKLISEHIEVMAWHRSALGGKFTEAQQASMRITAREVLADREQDGWTRRERFFAAIAIMATAAVSLVNILESMKVI